MLQRKVATETAQVTI